MNVLTRKRIMKVSAIFTILVFSQASFGWAQVDAAQIDQILKERNLSQYFKNVYASPWIKKSAIEDILKQESIFAAEAVFLAALAARFFTPESILLGSSPISGFSALALSTTMGGSPNAIISSPTFALNTYLFLSCKTSFMVLLSSI